MSGESSDWKRFLESLFTGSAGHVGPKTAAAALETYSEMFRTSEGLNRPLHTTSIKLPDYPMPSALEKVLNINEKSPLSRESHMYSQILERLYAAKHVDLSESHYVQLLKFALYMEEYQSNEEMKKRKLFNQTIKKVQSKESNEHLFAIHVEDLDEERSWAWIRENDFVDVTDTKTYQTYHLKVYKIQQNDIVAIDEHGRLASVYQPTNLYNVNFRFHNYPVRCAHYALWIAYKENVITYVFPQMSKTFINSSRAYYGELTMLNPNIETNPEQKQAVLNILNKSSFPAPYILYGPPGTGKTATLVEAISQIHKKSPSNCILVCTPSNTAADEVARRLLKFVDPSVLYRIYTQSKDKSTVDKELQNCCFCGGKKKVPLRREDITGKAILISTLCTSIRFLLMQLNPDYFSHIIIDEAGQGTEPDILIPIGIACKDGQLHSQIVLSGDPQQLGPTVISELANIVLGRSILERLMTYDTYKKDWTNKYNPKYITKLLHNYRSHPSIIHVSNKLFYENELVPKYSDNDNEVRFPVIFDGVVGVEEKYSYSPSTFNYEEIRTVLKWVYNLIDGKTEFGEVTAKDIGIVTPFKLQSKRIRKILHKKDAEEKRILKKNALKMVKLLKRGNEFKPNSDDVSSDPSECENSGSEEDKDVLESENGTDEFKLGTDISKCRNFKDINVGTVELFQGQERKIMIMTAVRSKTFFNNGQEHIGFLSNPKRFNVAMTRAQKALIVIGNPDVLQKDGMWQYLLIYCLENRSCRGLKFILQNSSLERPILPVQQGVVTTADIFKEETFKLFPLDSLDPTEDISKTVDLFVPPDQEELEKRRQQKLLIETLMQLSVEERKLNFSYR